MAFDVTLVRELINMSWLATVTSSGARASICFTLKFHILSFCVLHTSDVPGGLVFRKLANVAVDGWAMEKRGMDVR